LGKAIKRFQPEVIISLGEGHVGEFTIETIARNQRKHRADNLKAFPVGPIQKDGLDQISASIPAKLLLRTILDQSEHQIPIKMSDDAGAFLCEETLYNLESFRQATPLIKTVVFIHVPPYNSKLHYKGKEQKCDESLLADFIDHLLYGVLSIHQKA
jgi:pyroglutamyl-peptidase